MKKFTTLTGVAAPYVVGNIDTDKIIPKDFLKTVKRSGLGDALLYEVRYDMDGNKLPDFVLNKEPFNKAEILISGENFGCGSSREHAVWALTDFGIHCVIAPSFADIFYNNCTKNAVVPAIVSADDVETIAAMAQQGEEMVVDLPNQTITIAGKSFDFDIGEASKHRLLEGLDDISMTEKKSDSIDTFEKGQQSNQPWLYGVKAE